MVNHPRQDAIGCQEKVGGVDKVDGNHPCVKLGLVNTLGGKQTAQNAE
jgi:hypothetical protein